MGERKREFLDYKVMSTAQGDLRTSHTIKALLNQFDTQIIKPQVNSSLTVLNITQPTATTKKKAKLQKKIDDKQLSKFEISHIFI